VQAIRRIPEATECLAPVFAQQSVRENSRTGRTPQEVLDDATWGLFQEGWRSAWGADADHLKTPVAVETFTEAGYTMYTVDPGDQVDDEASTAGAAEIESKIRELPWEVLEDSPEDLERRYLSGRSVVRGIAESVDRETILRAAAKYGRAVAQAVTMYRCISSRMGSGSFELEVSVDETASPTSVVEHAYIASELRRLGVQWISLAPRFVGRFEKGVDYIGDLGEFSSEFARHARVARALGPYKLSLHSGSDKFTIYDFAARLAAGNRVETPGPLLHLKTAGTSYLEALRTVAQVDHSLLREILDFAREHYGEDRATYHVSARVARVPPAKDLSDDQLSALLDQFDARQVLHVTFGSVLDRFRDRLLAGLRQHEKLHHDLLATHFERHLRPFVR
jgi:hypothetical protein